MYGRAGGGPAPRTAPPRLRLPPHPRLHAKSRSTSSACTAPHCRISLRVPPPTPRPRPRPRPCQHPLNSSSALPHPCTYHLLTPSSLALSASASARAVHPTGAGDRRTLSGVARALRYIACVACFSFALRCIALHAHTHAPAPAPAHAHAYRRTHTPTPTHHPSSQSPDRACASHCAPRVHALSERHAGTHARLCACARRLRLRLGVAVGVAVAVGFGVGFG